MAQKGVQLEREAFSCSICLDLLKDPLTIPCGHSYCMKCIQCFWDEEEEKKTHSCPQCRQSFTPRPVLVKSTMLADLVEQLKKTGLQAAPADHCYAGPKDVASDVCCSVDEHKGHDTVSAAAERTKRQTELEGRRQNIQQRIQDREKEVKLLQQAVEVNNHSADRAVEDSEKIFTELIRLMEKRSSDVKQQIRFQKETEVSRVKELQEKLKQEITDLKRRDAELEQLSHTEDHSQFLQSYPSVSALSQPTDSSSINIRPLRHFEDVTAAVSELKAKLQDILRDICPNVPLTVTEVDVLPLQPAEPKTRAGFFKYSRKITLDPNTANTHLLLSDENRKVTFMIQNQVYSDHPDRFTGYCYQVLSRESLTGCCYWEVEWRGGGVYVAVAYKNISRAGDESLFGFNDKSWSLYCDNYSYEYRFNSIRTPVSRPQSFRVGVYLDHRAGVLSFYSVSETMTLLHRVQTTFTQPLHAALYLHNATAEMCRCVRSDLRCSENKC